MYKRRDWLLTHGNEGGGDSSSSDDSSEGGASGSDSEATSGEQPGPDAVGTSSEDSSSEDEEDGPARDLLGGGSDSDGELYARRLEDLSEEDFESGGSEGEEDEEAAQRGAQLAQQLELWTGTEAAVGKHKAPRGRPVKCVLCAGLLILNAPSLQEHLRSKKHKKNIADVAEDGHTYLALHEVLCFAEDYDAAAAEEETETYQERKDRVEAALKAAKQAAKEAAKASAAAAKAKAKEEEGKKGRRARQAERRKAAKNPAKKRPGKRQRQAQKDDVKE